MEFNIENSFPIYLYNTLTREKELFRPIDVGEVKIYTCGPTVYHFAHIGNLRAYVFSDSLRRMFEVNGYAVKQVINITDVGHLSSDSDEGEDKLEKGAKREGKSVWEVAQFYTDQFMRDLEMLNIEIPTSMPKATDHITEMIKLIQKLEENGLTYLAGGNLYFDTAKFTDYYQLAGGKIDSSQTESRVDVDQNKKNKEDFVLWFTNYKYTNHAMQWESPWGKGFPGWHIECSAMASKYLGDHFDIHTGGIDHISIHHTNEIAQSEGAFQHKWVNIWMHNDFLQVLDGVKMAKSEDNFLRLQSLIDQNFDPLDYRYFLLGGHYRTKMNFSFEALSGAKTALNRLKNQIDLIKEKKNENSLHTEHYRQIWQRFIQAINQDLNSAVALSILWEVVGDTTLSSVEKINMVAKMDRFFGLNLLEKKEDEIPVEVLALLEERNNARGKQDWAKSDELRDQILKRGYAVLDEKDKSRLQKIS